MNRTFFTTSALPTEKSKFMDQKGSATVDIGVNCGVGVAVDSATKKVLV